MKLIKRGLLASLSLFVIGAPSVVAELPWPECLPCPDDKAAPIAPAVKVKTAIQAGNIIWGD